MNKSTGRSSRDQSAAEPPAAGRATWIDEQADLEEMVGHLRGEPIIAADTEADSYYAYKVKVCLFQFSIPGRDYLVDPLAGLDLAALGDLFADSSHEIVFHAAENDVGLLGYLYGFRFTRLFDTMIAAQVLGYRRCGLAPLLEEFFGLEIPKRLQTSDWRRRPLSAAQTEYACTDTRHLLSLRAMLLAQLEQKGRFEEARCEFERIERCNWEPRPFDPDAFARIREARQLDPMARRRLKELYCCRDRLASRADRAPYRVLTDSELLRLVHAAPRRAAELADRAGLKEWKAERYGAALLEALRQAERKGPIEKMPHPRSRRPARSHGEMTSAERSLFEALRDWRARTAEQRDVIASRVSTTRMLVDVARRAPRNLEELSGLAGMERWRLDEYGQAILAVVREHATTESNDQDPD